MIHPRSRNNSRTLAFCLAVTATAGAQAQFAGLDTRLIGSGFTQPVFATAPLADGRVFVVEKAGVIKSVQGGVTTNFLSIAVNSDNEQGLLGLAFDPQYGLVGSAGLGRFFVNYTDPSNGDTVVASYRAAAGVANPASRVEVLRFDQPNGLTNHKAGWIGFKPGDNNHLFIATGDGGGSNDPSNSAQNRNVLLGKLLRVNINADDFAAPPSTTACPPAAPSSSRPACAARSARRPAQPLAQRLRGGTLAGGCVIGNFGFGNFVFGNLWALPVDAANLSYARAIDITVALHAGAAGALGNISSFGRDPAGELYVAGCGGKLVPVVPDPATAATLPGGLALRLGWRRQQRK